MKRKLFLIAIGLTLLLTSYGQSTASPNPDLIDAFLAPADSRACTSFCLNNSNYPVFGTNFDNRVYEGLLFVNKRNVSKTAWDPSMAGEYARWTSKYGSVTFNLVGYQFTWAGMNEAGLMISTMALAETQNPASDKRPPLESPTWVQYQLDNCSTVEEVIASDVLVRIANTVDHYLVCDRTGECAVIEFLGGKTVYHTGDTMPVKALANNTYRESVRAWQAGDLYNKSLLRFGRAANGVKSFDPNDAESAVEYAFNILTRVAGQKVGGSPTQWSIVFDTENLRAYFRTRLNRKIRYISFSKLDFSCSTPVQMLDIHEDLSDDISDDLEVYSHKRSLEYFINFFEKWGLDIPPNRTEALVQHLESFHCTEHDEQLRRDTPERGGPSPTTEERVEVLAQFEDEVENLRQKLKIPAFSAAIVKDQELVWAKGFGYADLENKIVATPDTPYHLASLTKPFAATIIMQLVEEGVLDLDEPVSKYGVDIESPSVVRVKHLLSMTSEGNPGERYRYNGDRFSHLSEVIKQASGKSFQELLFERILEPLGMTDTAPSAAGCSGLDERGSICKRVYSKLAQPYQLDSTYTPVKGQYPGHFSTAAGLISTVVDMAKFDVAIDQNILVHEETKEQMFAPTISTSGAELPYGLGWFSQRYKDTRLIWHYGSWDCISSLILKVPEENITFIILANACNLSRPFDLGGGDVLNSILALAFLKIFVFQPRYRLAVPEIDWEADERDLLSQLGQYNNEDVQEILEREIVSQGALFASVGRIELAKRLLDIYTSQSAPGGLFATGGGLELSSRLRNLIQTHERIESQITARLATDVDPKIFEAYVGQYEVPADFVFPIASVTVTSEDDRLYIEVPEGPTFELFPESETSFFHISVDAAFELTFIKDAAGQVTESIVEMEGQTFAFKKISRRTSHPWVWVIAAALILVGLVVLLR